MKLLGGISQSLAILISSPVDLADGRQLSVLTTNKEDRAVSYHRQLQLDCGELAEIVSRNCEFRAALVMKRSETPHSCLPFMVLSSWLLVRAERL